MPDNQHIEPVFFPFDPQKCPILRNGVQYHTGINDPEKAEIDLYLPGATDFIQIHMRKFLFIFFTCYLVAEMALSQTVSLASSNLPIVVINTRDTREIEDEPKIPAWMGIIDNGPGQINQVTDPYNHYDGTIGIELRGSSSQWFDKKNYGIEIWDENLQDTVASILGMPEEEDWVLHGPFSDKSLMRNFLTMNLSSKMGHYASRTVYCELLINGDYKGIYVFMEKVKRDSARVDISKLNPDEVTGDDLTGGYIVKIDKFDGSNSGNGWSSPYRPLNYQRDDQVVFFQFDYPKGDQIVGEQRAYIEEYITAFENALRNTSFDNLATGYKSYINLQSFIDYWIMNEVGRNVDGYRLSTFIYKDKQSQDNRLHLGPVWDFNLAFGNADYCRGSDIQGFADNFNQVCPEDFWLIPFWWKYMKRDPEFTTSLKLRWNQLRQNEFKTDVLLQFIDSTAQVLNQGASERNFQRWNILGSYLWPNNFVGSTYADEINYLKNWLSARLEWLDQAINDMEVTGIEWDSSQNISVNIFPNPFSREISFTISPTDPIETSVEILDLMGKVVWGKTIMPATGNLQFEWDGSDFSGCAVRPGIYLARVVNAKGQVMVQRILKQ